MYLDIPIGREHLNEAIDEFVEKSISAVRSVLDEGGLDTESMDELVFIGGPTHYEPLRRKVSDALGIPGMTETDPMTAVAVGAAIFAESVDWSTGSRDQAERQRDQAEVGDVRYGLNYDKRVTTEEAKVRISPISGCDGVTVEAISEQTGWTTGEVGIDGRTTITLRVTQMGENTYETVVKKGGQRARTASAIRINRSLSSVAAVPLTESIGIGVLAGTGHSGRTKMLWLARRGTELPVQDSVDVVANEALEAGDERSINMKVYTGEHDRPEENQAHGVLRIKGTDLDEGRIEAGAKLNVRYQIREGGQLKLTVVAADLRQEFRSDRNYYLHAEGAMNYRKAAGSIKDEAEELRQEVEETRGRVEDDRLGRALLLLDEVEGLGHNETDPETVKEHHDRTGEARNLLALTRKDHRAASLQIEVEKERCRWTEAAVWATDGTKDRVAKLFDAAAKAASAGDEECEDRLDDIRREIWETLWKEDWFVVQSYKDWRRKVMHERTGAEAASLIEKGDWLVERGDTERLREVVLELVRLVHGTSGEARWLLEDINIRAV